MSRIETTAVLDRIFEPADHRMTPEVAEWLVSIRADDEFQSRFDELADNNTEGKITPEELAEYDDYLRVAHWWPCFTPKLALF